MLGNDSHLQSLEEADNQFLPNHSNSYESIIKEHQQRRSQILNDHLMFDQSDSFHNRRQSLAHQSQDAEKTIEKKALEQNRHSQPEDEEENEQNQFLVNEKSLAASIKNALQSVNSKHNYSGLLDFQQNSNAIENEEESIPHFGGLQEVSILNKSNMEIDNQGSSHFHSKQDMSKNREHDWKMEIQEQRRHPDGDAQQESDPFIGAYEQVSANLCEQREQKSQLDFNQMQERPQGLNNSSNINFQQSIQKYSNQIHSKQKDALVQNSNLSGFDVDENNTLKSRSQIEALQSILQSKRLHSHQRQANEESQQQNQRDSNEFEQHSKHSVNQNQQSQGQNSLSRLVHENLYQKQYEQAEKANDSEFVVVNRIIASQIEIFQAPTINKINEQSRIKSQINNQIDLPYGEQPDVSKQSEINSQQRKSNDLQILDQSNNIQKQFQSPRLNFKQEQIFQRSIVNKYDFSSNKLMNQSFNNSFKEQSAKESNIEVQKFEANLNQDKVQSKIQSVRQDKQMFYQEQSALQKTINENKAQLNEQKENQLINGAFNQEQDHNENSHFHEQNENVKELEQEKNERQSSSFLQVNKSNSFNQSKNVLSQKLSSYKQKDIQLNPSKLSQLKRSVNQSIKLRNIQPFEGYSLKSSKKQAIEKESQLHLPYIQNKRRQSELINGLKASNTLSKQSPSIKMEQGSKISGKNSKYSVQSKHHSSNIQKNQRDKIVSYSEGVSQQQDTKIHLPQMQPGSTGIESKSTFTKKKQENNREIFNTYPATFQLENCDQVGFAIQESRKKTLKNESIQSEAQKKNTVGSPSKQRESQIQRVRILKENHRKRLQRQLQKVKKQLQEINSWQKNMQKIYEQKQKIQNKQKQKALTLKEKEPEIKKNTKISRQNQVILKIIKDHRKSKQQITYLNENLEDLPKNLAQLVNLRNQAQQKLKQQKRQQIAQRMKRNESRKLQQQKLIKVNNHYIKQFKSVEASVVSPTKDIQPKIEKLNNNKGSKYQGNIRMKANPYEEKLD